MTKDAEDVTYRSSFTTVDIIHDIWTQLNLPKDVLDNYTLTGEDEHENPIPSSFKAAPLAHAAITLSGLAASQIYTDIQLNDDAQRQTVHHVTVDKQHAVAEYRSDQLISIDGEIRSIWDPLTGVYACSDGNIGTHANFKNHKHALMEILGLPKDCLDRDVVANAVKKWKRFDLEEKASPTGGVIFAQRTIAEWDALKQSKTAKAFPIHIKKISNGPPGLPKSLQPGAKSAVQGLKVLELTRAIAGPISARMLAAHGADVLWLHSPKLPNLPTIDADTSRGKRSAFLDLNDKEGQDQFEELLKETDVFIQSFRPGSIAKKGFSAQDVAKLRGEDGIIYANLSAFCQSTQSNDEDDPWALKRGFDSLVQLVSGISSAEAESYNSHHPTSGVITQKSLPCQVLDHTGGYFLGIGILTALHRKIREGGSYEVSVGLSGVAEYLKSLGRVDEEGMWDENKGSYGQDGASKDKFMETRPSKLGEVKAVKHAVQIEGLDVGWNRWSQPLGGDSASWN